MESLAKDSEWITKGRWQWKSNPDPWSKSEKPQWKSYSLEHNYLIEKAHYDQQKEVDIGDYIILMKHMIQRKKTDVTRRRPIRRIDWKDNIEEMARSERYFKTELPKTMNKVFGSLRDFLGFLSRRNPEMLDWTSKFEESEKSNDLESLNQKIVPQVVSCLEAELLKSLQEQLNGSLLSELKNKLLLKAKERHAELISLFKKEFLSFEEFYGEDLRAYTMNTSLYENLNKYLRNESWIEADNLLPYTFCLCKAFFNFNFRTDLIIQDNTEDQITSQGMKSILLYRGTAFDESALKCYHEKVVEKYFSWNSVSSTTTSKTVAQDFMYKSVDLEIKKYPVLFTIEVPTLTNSRDPEYLEWIDVYQYSDQKEENEIILPPGSIFEILEVTKDTDKRTSIRLKLRRVVRSVYGGFIMQGALQNEMTKKDTKIAGLEGEKLFETLKRFTGNKLVENIEFLLCTFDKRSIEVMLETFPTLERVRELKVLSCIFQDIKWLKYLPKLESLTLGFSLYSAAERSYLSIFEGLKNLTKLTSLTIILSDSEKITDESILELASKLIGNLKKLRSLAVDLFDCRQLTDKGIYSLAFEGLRNLNELTSLSLDFRQCPKITNGGFENLASKGLINLTQLASFAFYFSQCSRVTDHGLRLLTTEGLKHLTQLKSLTLQFPQCPKITNEGCHYLASEGLQFLVKLSSLTFDFLPANTITNKGISNLVFERLNHLTQLTSLTLQFCDAYGISDEGIHCLASRGLQRLTKLTSLALRFSESSGITDEGVRILASEGLSHLVQLKSLSLNFSGCFKVKNEGLRVLGSQGLIHLTSLTFLALYFSSHKIKKGVVDLASEGLKYLTNLASLTLCFPNSAKLTDEAVNILGAQGLKYLIRLTSLTLDLSGCEKIGNEGVCDLVSEGLYGLTQLTSLNLNLSGCKKISDRGVHYVKSQILKQFKQMVFIPAGERKLKFVSNSKDLWAQQSFEPAETKKLVLKRVSDNYLELFIEESFTNVDSENKPPNHTVADPYSLEISSQSTIILEAKNSVPKKGILQPIDLNAQNNFDQIPHSTSKPSKITDEDLSIIASQKLKHLTQLRSLSLHFEQCKRVTDEGLLSLASEGLKSLTQLKSLSLHCEACTEITDKGIESLVLYGLQNMTQLTSLTLDFKLCSKITNQGLEILPSNGLKHLNQLTSLSLGFKDCFRISNVGLKSLAIEGLRNLAQLKSLTLCFANPAKGVDIKDSGLRSLASEGLQYLSQLTSLSLDFSHCTQITGRGLQGLASEGLKHLSQLTSLSLDFSQCNLISDQGVSRLESEGLRHLTQLISLNLNFNSCRKITKFALSNIIRVLYYFGFLMF